MNHFNSNSNIIDFSGLGAQAGQNMYRLPFPFRNAEGQETSFSGLAKNPEAVRQEFGGCRLYALQQNRNE